MKIAVLGATRGIGLEVVKAALAEGHEVTGLARHPERMPIEDARLWLVKGDAQDAQIVAQVIEGQDVVCDCLGTTQLKGEVRLFSRSAENLACSLSTRSSGRSPLQALNRCCNRSFRTSAT